MSTSNVLVVDDDPVILELLATNVEEFGFNCVKAEDGTDAVEKLEKETFSIVLTDMMMPNMDGMQLLQHIRANYPQIDVIVITGYDHTFTYTDVIKAGASDFISKPFDSDELQAKLNRVVREQKLIRQLERHSIYDGLTDIYNRRYFDIKLMEETQRAQRQGYDIFLGLVDVDNLKGYNDESGHQAGDHLLKTVGGILKQSIRENVDLAFRYGGDEFGVIFSQVDMEHIVDVADRILEKYRLHDFPETGLSIGIARFSRRKENTWGEDVEDLISRADRALYKAKNTGKNRLVLDDASTTEQ